MKALVLSALALLGVLLLPGCPGELENPEEFSAICDPPGTLFPKKCGSSTCHDAKEPAANLDLVSPGVIERLVDVRATCADPDPDDDEACVCADRLRVDSLNPDGSYLLEKVNEEFPECDDQMPQLGQALRSRDAECLRNWILEITGNAVEET